MSKKKPTGAPAKSGAGTQPAIGDPLREYVAKSGLTWYQLSQETGLHTAALYKWRDGADLSQASLEVLASYFGLTLRPAPRKRKGK